MYYSVKEISNVLECDPETIRRKIRNGKLKAFKVNDQFKVREEDVIEMLKKTIIGIDLGNKTLDEILNFIKK